MKREEEVKIVKKTFITKQENISDTYLLDAKAGSWHVT